MDQTETADRSEIELRERREKKKGSRMLAEGKENPANVVKRIVFSILQGTAEVAPDSRSSSD